MLKSGLSKYHLMHIAERKSGFVKGRSISRHEKKTYVISSLCLVIDRYFFEHVNQQISLRKKFQPYKSWIKTFWLECVNYYFSASKRQAQVSFSVFFITCKKIEVLLFTFSQRSQLLAKHLLKHTDGLVQKRFHWFLVQLIKLIALIYRTKDFCFVHRNI